MTNAHNDTEKPWGRPRATDCTVEPREASGAPAKLRPQRQSRGPSARPGPERGTASGAEAARRRRSRERPRFEPGAGKTPWRRTRNHSRALAWRTPGQRGLAGCGPWGLKEADRRSGLAQEDMEMASVTRAFKKVGGSHGKAAGTKRGKEHLLAEERKRGNSTNTYWLR